MIPFGSQRAYGQDLATHLLNAQDNQQLEIADVRGAVARDLHGAFAEWEAQAHALTRCRKYLYSLSVNPDPAQEPLSRAQYGDYIARVEEGLGLTGQPRAIVFHVKDGREHCHVIWSRIDTAAGKAVKISFDREKLMAITRSFARDHGLTVPDGYYRAKDAPSRDQLLPHEKHQQETTGLSKEERIAQVTAAWRASDSPRAFIQALQEHGYILATGRRDYVLVDRYGNTNSLPRLIDDPGIRTRQVRAFLEPAFPPGALPSVEEARGQAARLRMPDTQQGNPEQAHETVRRAALELKQASRRQEAENKADQLAERQREERAALADRHLRERTHLKISYRAQAQRIRQRRARNRPTGLAAFLGRITGVALITRKLQRYRDRTRFREFLAQKRTLQEQQAGERTLLARRHELQALDNRRRLRALALIERRERRALENALLREQRRQEPVVPDHLPEPGNAAPRDPGPDARLPRRIDLREAFEQAAGGDEEESGDHGDTTAPAPPAAAKTRRHRRRKQYLYEEFNQASGADESEEGEGDSRGGPGKRRRKRPKRPRSELGRSPSPGRRRKRKRDFDHGR